MTKLTEGQFHEALVAVAQADGSKIAAAASINLSLSALNRRLANGRRLYGDTTEAMIDTPEGFAVKGTSSLVRSDGTIAAQWIKTTRDTEDTEELAKAIERRFEKWAKRAPKAPKLKTKTMKDQLSTYIIADAHLGMYAWGEETGTNMDLQISVRNLRACFSRLVAATPATETAVILELGDFFHADDNDARTKASKNQLDVDGRHQKVLDAGVELTIWAIHHALTKHEKVVYVSKRGNHDPTSGMILPIALKYFFQNEPRVTIDVSPTKHWFYQFGTTMLGGTHGDSMKQEKMASIMPAEEPQMWGNTLYRYFWSGHLHHRKVQEFPGVTCEIARTLTSRDAWHAAAGYGALREMSAVVYSKTQGEIERYTARPDVGR